MNKNELLERINLLTIMDNTARRVNDEDIFEYWLQGIKAKYN